MNPDGASGLPADTLIRYIDISSLEVGSTIRAERCSEYTFSEAPSRAKRLVRTGDIVVGLVDPGNRKSGRVPAALDGQVASTGTAVLRGEPGVLDTGFLWCLVRSNAFVEHLVSRQAGSVYPAVKARDLGDFSFALPPLQMQQAIAIVIEKLDSRIEWCSQLRRLGMATQIQLLDQHLKTGSFVPLGEYCQLDKGVSYKGKLLSSSPEASLLINLGIFSRDKIPRWSKLKRYAGQAKDRHSVGAGDVVICATDMTQDRAVLGQVAVVPQWIESAYVTHHLYSLRCSDDAPFPPWLAGLAISYEPTRRRLAAAANGTTVLSLPKDVIHEVQVPVLGPRDLEVHDNAFWSIQRRIDLAVREQLTLIDMRNMLIEQLLSFELELDNPQALLEQVE